MQDIDVHSEFKNCVVLSMAGHMPPEGTTAWTQEVEQCMEQLPRTPEAATLLVMNKFLNLLGALRACVDFRDSTAFSRFVAKVWK